MWQVGTKGWPLHVKIKPWSYAVGPRIAQPQPLFFPVSTIVYLLLPSMHATNTFGFKFICKPSHPTMFIGWTSPRARHMWCHVTAYLPKSRRGRQLYDLQACNSIFIIVRTPNRSKRGLESYASTLLKQYFHYSLICRLMGSKMVQVTSLNNSKGKRRIFYQILYL